MKNKEIDSNTTMHLYWFSQETFKQAKAALIRDGIRVVSSKLTPCEVLRASGNKVIYATPEVWSRMCVRQGSWYRSSERFGQYMMMSENKLPKAFEKHLDSEITATDFVPKSLPTALELQKVVNSDSYQKNKPEEWEAKTLMDAIMFKTLFSLTLFWKWGDNLKNKWLSHKANHANFLSHDFTTEIDGESVPYSIAENAGICSSCVETFNIIDQNSRKLVRACPGAATFGGAKRDVYLDVKPMLRVIN